MPDRVSEVEHLTQAALALIHTHNSRLKADRLNNYFFNHGGIAIQNLTPLLFEKPEQSGIADDPALDRLIESRAILSRRQCSEHVRINQHRGRLMKCPKQILSRLKVDAGLSA